MATYFGEVILPTSRAFWNDDDEDEMNEGSMENVKFITKWVESEPLYIENFLIVESEMATDFVKKCLLDNIESICTIDYEYEKMPTKIYYVSNFYVCLIHPKLNLAQAAQLTENIIPLISKAKNLFGITCDHLSHFKCEEEINLTSFLKSLYSQKAKMDKIPKIAVLNQPNIITGVCAGALTYAEVANLNCIVYILYSDTFVLDSENALPLIELFYELLGRTIPNSIIGTPSFNKGNLYM